MEEELAREAVGHALRSGAQYAEARVQRDLGHTYTLKNGTAEPVNVTRKVGIGIRVIVDGALGFASTNSLDREQLRSTTESAVRTAKASKRLVTSPIRLSQEKSWEDNWEAKMKVDVRDVSPEEKYELLFTIEKSLTPENVHVSLPSRILIFDEDLTEKFYVNSEGSKLHGFVPRLSLLFFLTAQEPGKGVAQRLRHEAQSRGWEVVEDWKPKEIAADDAKMLGRLLREGVPPPKGEVDFVLGSEVTGIICHESCGHPQEADRILGREAAQAGESYLKPDMVGRRIGSEHVTIIDDPTLPNSYGFYLYDDEGVKARPRVLIQEGLIAAFLQNRETAAELGGASNGAARSSSYDREPIIRMANTYMKPGNHSLEELIEGVGNGIYMRNFMEWNIDDRRYNQRYVGLEAYMIENGRITTPIRNPILEITTPGLYGSVDAVGKDMEYAGATCGKGDPMQGAPVWTGGPPIRLRKIRLGG
ncbi:MAG: TldD/PmbA family protein [Candidatus Bathyarchaeia archaeon]